MKREERKWGFNQCIQNNSINLIHSKKRWLLNLYVGRPRELTNAEQLNLMYLRMLLLFD